MTDVWAHLAERYEQAYGPKTDSPCWSRARSLARSTEGIVLDIACGPGYDLSLFSQGVGIDSSPAMLRAARKRAPNAGLVLGDMRHLPFRRGSLAGAFSCLALIHLTKAELNALLVDLHGLLRADAAVSALFFSGSGERDTGFSPLDPRAIAHYSFYQRDEIAGIFRDCGYGRVAVEEGILNEPASPGIPCLCVTASA